MNINKFNSDVGGTLLLTNICQIVQIVDDDKCTLLKEEMKKIKILEDEKSRMSIYCENGKIKEICPDEEFIKQIVEKDVKILDCNGGCVLPGFVDAHTHAVFAGDRVNEFAMKLNGATYMEVQEAGGGIHFTTEKTREASEKQLLSNFIKIAKEMSNCGTTLVEAKSGYGLTTESEIKMLNVLQLATVSKNFPLEISSTFCGAHAIPKNKTEDEQTQAIINEMLPEIEKLKKNGQLLNLENVDVFCEKNVFELESTKKILEAAKNIGLRPNFHADELFPLGGAELAAELKATAVSHLEEISDEGVRALAKSGTVAVLLPSTAYVLKLKSPPVRKMIQSGVCVALGSDFNPNAYCFSMPTIMNLACVLFGLSMPEALVAATLHSAHSLGRGKTHGAISEGRIADLVVLNTTKWEHIIYQLSAHQSIIEKVIKYGKVVYSKTKEEG